MLLLQKYYACDSDGSLATFPSDTRTLERRAALGKTLLYVHIVCHK